MTNRDLLTESQRACFKEHGNGQLGCECEACLYVEEWLEMLGAEIERQMAERN